MEGKGNKELGFSMVRLGYLFIWRVEFWKEVKARLTDLWHISKQVLIKERYVLIEKV
jgi:hypothetical protein